MINSAAIGDIDNVEMVVEISKNEWNKDQTQKVEEIIKPLNLTYPILIINKVDRKKMEETVAFLESELERERGIKKAK